MSTFYTFSFNPMVFMHFCALIQTAILVFLIIYPEGYKPKKKVQQGFYYFFMSLATGTLVTFGVQFIDAGILWLLGNWSMSDWLFQLPNAVLLVLIGIQYVVVPLLRKGNWLDIGYLVVVVIVVQVFYRWWVPLDDVMGPRLEEGLPVLLGVLIGIYVLIGEVKFALYGDHAGRDAPKLQYKWDIGKKIRHVYNRKVNVVLWILTVAQSIMSFMGYSIITIFIPM